MVQEIQVKQWCDRCVATGDHVEGKTVTVSLSIWPMPLEIDLCEEHYKIISDLDQILNKFGRPDAIRKSKPLQPQLPTKQGRYAGRPLGGGVEKQRKLALLPDAVGCPMCKTLANGPKSLAAHLRKQHDMLASAFSEEEIAVATVEARQKAEAL